MWPGGTNAATRNWVLAATGADKSRIYVDSLSIVYLDDEPSQVVFWGKTTNSVNRIGGKLYRSNIFRDQIDCADDTIAFGPATFYDYRGRVVYSDSNWGEWQNIVPESIAEAERDFVCARWDNS